MGGAAGRRSRSTPLRSACASSRTRRRSCATTTSGVERSAPLFATGGESVAVRPRGIAARPDIARCPEMEALVISETKKVLADYSSRAGEYEGLIYMMLWPEGERVLPLYVGKSEKYGRGGGNLSASIASIETNRHKFCRWGDGYAYHISAT